MTGPAVLEQLHADTLAALADALIERTERELELACDLTDAALVGDRAPGATADPCQDPTTWSMRCRRCGSVWLICDRHLDMARDLRGNQRLGCGPCRTLTRRFDLLFTATPLHH